MMDAELDLYPRGIYHTETLGSENVLVTDDPIKVAWAILKNYGGVIVTVTFESNDTNLDYFIVELAVNETVIIPEFLVPSAVTAGTGGLRLSILTGTSVRATVFYHSTLYDPTQYIA